MFNFFKDFFLGKKFKISAAKTMEYEKIKTVFRELPSELIPQTVVTGDDFKRLVMEIPFFFQWKSNKIKTNNLAIPTIAYQWFRSGGTWKEMDDYEAVSRHGMLHGKKMRLCLT